MMMMMAILLSRVDQIRNHLICSYNFAPEKMMLLRKKKAKKKKKQVEFCELETPIMDIDRKRANNVCTVSTSESRSLKT